MLLACILLFVVTTIAPFLSSIRFDLIFLVLDPQDEQFDRRLATHLVSLYHQTKDQEETLYMVGMILQSHGWCTILCLILLLPPKRTCPL